MSSRYTRYIGGSPLFIYRVIPVKKLGVVLVVIAGWIVGVAKILAMAGVIPHVLLPII